MRYLCTLIVLCTLTFSTSGQLTAITNSDCDFDLNFKFIITHNFADKTSREVEVFLDPQAFNDKNLKKLFSYFATKYKSPNIMEVRVETSWYTVAAPNIDCEGEAMSNMPDDPEKLKYHWALYLRSGNDEVYRFNPKLGERSMETVLLKGKLF